VCFCIGPTLVLLWSRPLFPLLWCLVSSHQRTALCLFQPFGGPDFLTGVARWDSLSLRQVLWACHGLIWPVAGVAVHRLTSGVQMVPLSLIRRVRSCLSNEKDNPYLHLPFLILDRRAIRHPFRFPLRVYNKYSPVCANLCRFCEGPPPSALPFFLHSVRPRVPPQIEDFMLCFLFPAFIELSYYLPWVPFFARGGAGGPFPCQGSLTLFFLTFTPAGTLPSPRRFWVPSFMLRSCS